MVQNSELFEAVKYLVIHSGCWKMHVERKVTTKCKTSYDHGYLGEIKGDIEKAEKLIKEYYAERNKTIH